MAAAVSCSRCQQEREGLDSAPTGGPMGLRVLENVCRDCWQQWRESSAQLINHHGLVLGDPRTRARLRGVMHEFLGLDGPEA